MENIILVVAILFLGVSILGRFMRAFEDKKFSLADIFGRCAEMVALCYIIIHCVL